MGVLTLLEQARAVGLIFEARGDRLIVRGPRSAGPLARAVGDRKAEVLAILGDPCRDADPGTSGVGAADGRQAGPLDEDAPAGAIDPSLPGEAPWRIELAGWVDARREAWEERAGIMEHDGGLSRGEAEHRVFVEVSRLSQPRATGGPLPPAWGDPCPGPRPGVHA